MVEGVKAGGLGGAAPLVRDGARATGGTFSVSDGGAPLTTGASPSSVAAIGLDSMLALQGVDEATQRDRKARERGTAMIAALIRLQRAMLAAEDPAAALGALTELSADTGPADDPALGAILREVVLRSRVEIARREVAAGWHDRT